MLVAAGDDEDARRDRAGGEVDHAAAVEDAAVGRRLEHVVQLGDGRLVAAHPALADAEVGRVRQRRHLDHGLGAVDEAAQHLRVHLLAGGLGGQAGRGVVRAHRVVLALARADDVEGEVAGELDELERLGRLVAAAQGVDRAGLGGDAGEQPADGDVGLDVEQADVLAGEQAAQGDLRADLRDAGGVDDHVDGQGRQQGRVVDRDGAAVRDDAAELVVVVARDHVLDAGRLQGAGGALDVDVGDGDDLHAGDPADLGDESPADLPGADQADPDRPPVLDCRLEEALTVCHFGFS